MEELTVEEIIFEIGILHKQNGDGSRQIFLCRALERIGILVEDNSMGNGWRVIDDSGMSDMPSKAVHLVWSNSAYAWAFWMGMGMPHGRFLRCESDPVLLHASIGGGKIIDLDKIEIVKSAPKLRVVK